MNAPHPNCPVEKKKQQLTRFLELYFDATGIPKDELLSKSRKQRICDARQVAMYLARFRLWCLRNEIADIMQRDCSAVGHSNKKARQLLRTSPDNSFVKECYRIGLGILDR